MIYLQKNVASFPPVKYYLMFLKHSIHSTLDYLKINRNRLRGKLERSMHNKNIL